MLYVMFMSVCCTCGTPVASSYVFVMVQEVDYELMLVFFRAD